MFYQVMKRYRLSTLIEFIAGYMLMIYIFDISIHWEHFIISCVAYIICFGLIYPIVYIYNDIADLKQDKQCSARLAHKPLAAGKIDLDDFIGIGIIWLGIGIIFLYFIQPIFTLFLGIAIVFNFFYTKYFKHMFLIENIANALTHTINRFLLAMLVVVIYYDVIFHYNLYNITAYIVVFTLFHWLFFFLGAFYKRYLECRYIGTKSRKTLVKYENKTLMISIIIISNMIWIILVSSIFYLTWGFIISIIFLWLLIIANSALIYKKSPVFDKAINYFYLN